jgi:2,3-bisphosphoglycerate-dependent phosphoglycerate mutase
MAKDHLGSKYKDYSGQKILEAVMFLSYHKAPQLPKKELEGYPTMYIFRHGQSIDNANFIFSGWRTSKLTEKGREQAQVLAKKMAGKKLDLLVSSPQLRATETMEIVIAENPRAKDLIINTDDRIKERNYGVYQGESKLIFQLERPEELAKIRRTFDHVPEGGESISMVCDRVAEFCDGIIPLMRARNINVGVSCHGNSIRGFRRYFEGLSNEETATVETPLGKDYAAYLI